MKKWTHLVQCCTPRARPSSPFDSVMDKLFSFHVVQPLGAASRRNAMVQFFCSCKRYQDDGSCEHALYEGLKCGVIAVPVLQHLFCIGRLPKLGGL
mmetsp:Transcript_24481/g.60163  ORF Transcript_24481/g.60163 Transcript_24481/m.60163 type:complete len:96 (-) Transcript_24481:11-298(-)